MKRTPFDALITQKSLEFLSQYTDLADLAVQSLEEGEELNVPLKNVCARVAVPLAEKIDSICSLLGISKRRFLETAFSEAVIKAEAIMEAEGVYEMFEEVACETEKTRDEEAA